MTDMIRRLPSVVVNGMTYFVGETSAPRAYDGFGVIEWYAHDDASFPSAERGVAIPASAADWYAGRLHSGLYTVEYVEVDGDNQLYPDALMSVTQAIHDALDDNLPF